jgi:hypothetical protein
MPNENNTLLKVTNTEYIDNVHTPIEAINGQNSTKENSNNTEQPKSDEISTSRRSFLRFLAGGTLLTAGLLSGQELAKAAKDIKPKRLKIEPVLPEIAETIGDNLVSSAREFNLASQNFGDSVSTSANNFFDQTSKKLKDEEDKRLVNGIKRMNP